MSSPHSNSKARFDLMRGLTDETGKKDAAYRILSWGLPVTLTVAGLALLWGTNPARPAQGVRP